LIVVVADTSGLLAALDENHPDGDAARTALRDSGTLIVSPLLLSELDHVVRRVLGRDAAHQAIDDIRRWARAGRAVLPEVTADILDTAQAVRGRYRDLRLDLADAVNVAFAAQFHTDAVLTLDHRDFRAIHPLTDHRAFRFLPDDG
jgi:predicted nucleic acid-binding protein